MPKRKYPVCKLCGNEIKDKKSNALYCSECGEIHDKERKERNYLRRRRLR